MSCEITIVTVRLAEHEEVRGVDDVVPVLILRLHRDDVRRGAAHADHLEVVTVPEQVEDALGRVDRLRVDRDLLRVGRDGVDKLVVHPHDHVDRLRPGDDVRTAVDASADLVAGNVVVVEREVLPHRDPPVVELLVAQRHDEPALDAGVCHRPARALDQGVLVVAMIVINNNNKNNNNNNNNSSSSSNNNNDDNNNDNNSNSDNNSNNSTNSNKDYGYIYIYIYTYISIYIYIYIHI